MRIKKDFVLREVCGENVIMGENRRKLGSVLMIHFFIPCASTPKLKNRYHLW